MSAMSDALDGYLEYRQRFGWSHTGYLPWILGRFVAHADSVGAERITSQLFLDWRNSFPETGNATWVSRLACVRNFAKWWQLRDPSTEVPPSNLIRSRKRRPAPYIYSEEEIVGIIAEAGRLPSPGGLRALTYQTLFGLLAVTGLRLGEALALDDDDIDLESGVLTIRQSKNGSVRFVPVASSTCERIATYRDRRRQLFGAGSGPLFLCEKGRRPVHNTVQAVFAGIGKRIGLRDADTGTRNGRGPRIHDLRHTLAVNTMIQWYRDGCNANREVMRLTAFLGHRHPNHTFWYIEAVPELMQLARIRADRAVEDRQ